MGALSRIPLCIFLCGGISLAALAQDAPSATFRGEATPTPGPSLSQTPSGESAPKLKEASSPKLDQKPPGTGADKASELKAETTPATETRVDEVDHSRDRRGLDLRQMEKEWEASPHNRAIIEKLVAEDFVGVTSEGKIVTKKAMLKGASDEPEKNSSSILHMDVRRHGPKVAIVIGTSKVSGQEKNGQKFKSVYRFTDTWMERDGKWQCIASQATTVTGK